MRKHLRTIGAALVVMLPVIGVYLGPMSTAAPRHVQRAVSTAASSTAPRFGRPTISGIAGTGFEQDLRLDPQGRVYTSVPESLSSTISNIWRSLDGGSTFKYIPASAPLTGKLTGSCPVGGGDTELATDTAGHLYFSDLTLANLDSARSDDHGRSFAGTSCASVATTPDDRQWLATDGNPLSGGNIYQAYDIVGGDPGVCRDEAGDPLVANNQLVLARSPLAGDATGQSAGVQYNPSQFVNGTCHEGIMGNDEVSPVTNHIFVVHDDADFDSIWMGRCQKVPFTTDPTGLSCVDRLVTKFPGSRTGGNFPTMAIDRSGNLYAVWEQAPAALDGTITGDTKLFWSSSRDEGDHWTRPVQIPTPGLRNNVFAWAAAGDAGRVDVAWYGTPATDSGLGGCSGPDGVNGNWSLWMTQTLNGTAATPSFKSPSLASEHFVHHGSIQTVMAGQCGDRTLGDFIQLRIGKQGEANISYADSNNQDEAFVPHGMFTRQIGGTGVYAGTSITGGAPTNAVADPSGDASYEANGMVDPYTPNMDVLGSSVTKPDASHYRITMKVKDLRSLAPDPTTTDTDTALVWNTQWLVPSTTDPNGGKNFFVYMESKAGGPPTCWTGENAAQDEGGGVSLTYPGQTDLTSSCSYTATAPGTISITVPTSAVSEPGAINNKLYSVTASAMTVPVSAECAPTCGGFPSGSEFNLIDVARAYDFIP